VIVTQKTNIADASGKSYADGQEGGALIFRSTNPASSASRGRNQTIG
jgi:hypothetical protein